MSYKRTIPFGLAIMFFCIAIFASWYEGSELVDNSFEWKHTAVFTSWIHDGEVERGNISQLDYFVYSIKFKPIFPIIMMVSFIYMIFAIGQNLLKPGLKQNLFVSILGVILLVGAGLLSGSPTSGAKVFMMSQLLVGILLIGLAVFHQFRKVQLD
ncbi:YjdJ family protein [Sutcliffiella horikoshii]|uniref:YjdJ family protein n=1 Tax=Sutcliffiella horikoshii TaxID=79883 RepID=UPI001CBB2480|nr:YjdJ family protein [Sutcliffiella horikoshii]UAL45904.1 YjdJ family protein [Sutcliffiella horikoshii]